MVWNTMDSVPEKRRVDLWVVNKKDKFPPQRFTDMIFDGVEWFGSQRFMPHDVPTHWMYAPDPPPKDF